MILRPTSERPDLAALVIDDDLFDRAVAEAQAEAVRRHRLLGQPVVVWRDGNIVIEVPGDVEGTPGPG